ncbi:hypothetical protein OROMI_005932 [Orobanche minor]
MIPTLISSKNPLSPINSGFQKPKICCSQRRNPKNVVREYRKNRIHFLNPITINPDEEIHPMSSKSEKHLIFGRKKGSLQMGNQDMMVLCGLGYYVNGFRGFPWLALNFHMAHNLNMNPSTLQLVQNSGNLPMVAKPLYGILSDSLCIGGAHRIPYISIGGQVDSRCCVPSGPVCELRAAVPAQAITNGIKDMSRPEMQEQSVVRAKVLHRVLSWGSLALIPVAREARPFLMACVLISNLGASLAEVAKDALITEYGHKNKIAGLQSYAYMASAVGGVLANLIGGFFLLKTQQTKSMFLAFVVILALQLTVSLRTREESLGLSRPSDHAVVRESIKDAVRKQYSDLKVAIRDESVARPLIWVVSSVLTVPMLSGSIFCYQTQCLNLNPSIIGLSKVTGQLTLLSLTLLYDRFWKNMPMRKLAGYTQFLYAFLILFDLVLVKQLNVRLGISSEVFTFCFSGVAETVAQFKLLPFYVLFASLAPPGCEGSLMSFLASASCLSSVVSGFLGVGLASFLGITYGDYSSLPLGILIQFFAALLPLWWIGFVPMSRVGLAEKARRRGSRSKRTRRSRRVGRALFDSVYSYRQGRESDLQR